MTFYHYFAEAATTEESGGIFDALGIDWQLLIIQIIAFVIFVWLLSKFVYPWLMKSVDRYHDDLESAKHASDKAEKLLKERQHDIDLLLENAHKEAQELVADAKDEAAGIVSASEKKAQAAAERIADQAKKDVARDVDAARRALRAETIELVAQATEKVVNASYAKGVDEKLIKDALKEAK